MTYIGQKVILQSIQFTQLLIGSLQLDLASIQLQASEELSYARAMVKVRAYDNHEAIEANEKQVSNCGA